jgi:hypothetical protein
MFIREPIIGELDPAAGFGQSLAAYGAITWDPILADVLEATLIEEIQWSAIDFSSLAGMLALRLSNPTNEKFHLGSFAIPAGSSTLMANGRIVLNVELPVGWGMEAAHNVTRAGAIFVQLKILPLGGILR